jgi:hypothetical protein
MTHDNEAETDRFKILAKIMGAEIGDDRPVEENVITV